VHRGSRDGDAVLKSLEQLINDAVGMTRTASIKLGISFWSGDEGEDYSSCSCRFIR
jgi:hypothetical protein